MKLPLTTLCPGLPGDSSSSLCIRQLVLDACLPLFLALTILIYVTVRKTRTPADIQPCKKRASSLSISAYASHTLSFFEALITTSIAAAALLSLIRSIHTTLRSSLTLSELLIPWLSTLAWIAILFAAFICLLRRIETHSTFRPILFPSLVFAVSSIHEVIFASSLISRPPSSHDPTSPTAFDWSGVWMHISILRCGISIVICGLLAAHRPIYPNATRKNRPITKEMGSSIAQIISFSWLDPLLALGRRRPLLEDDLWGLLPAHRSARCHTLFTNARRSVSMAATMLYLYRYDLALQFLHSILWSLLVFLPPYCLSIILIYLRARQDEVSDVPHTPGPPTSTAILAVLGLFLGSIGQSTFFQQSLHVGRSLAIRAKATLSAEIFSRTLSAPPALASDGDADADAEGKKEEDIVSLLNVDVNKVANFIAYGHYIYAFAIQISLSLFFLHQFLGWPSALACLITTLLLSPITASLTRAHGRIQSVIMRLTDVRMSRISELLRGIRVVKYFAWEEAYLQRIDDIRQEELDALWIRLRTYISLNTMAIAIPVVSMSVTFVIFTTVGGGHLTAATAFPSLSLFSVLRRAIEELPEKLVYATDASVSLARIYAALPVFEPPVEGPENEKHSSHTVHDASPLPLEDTIGITGGASFVWGGHAGGHNQEGTGGLEERWVLSEVDVSFPRGALTVIGGPTGSGKTALLMALLGEMAPLSGHISLPRLASGRGISYVPQQPWLQNATIRANILFGQAYDQARYSETIRSCALDEDFVLLPGGDATEVGEKGFALSGGQKQRISLARAVYSPTSIVLLDDVLSAVDAHTSRHLYEQCLLGSLMRSRTLILVTHQVPLCVQAAAFLVMMADGKIAASGPVREMLSWVSGTEEVGTASAAPSSGLLAIPGSATKGSEEPEQRKRGSTAVWMSLEEEIDAQASSSRARADLSIQQIPTTSPGSSYGSKNSRAEHSAQGKVSWDVYKTYAQAAGSSWFWAWIGVLFVLTEVFLFSQGYWLKVWTSSEGDGTLPDYHHAKYAAVYVALGGGAIIGSIIRHYIVYRAAIRVSYALHHGLLRRVVGSPMSFFEGTPIGRIMNRFSADMETLDQAVPPNASYFAIACIQTVGVMIMISLVMPVFLIVAVAIAVLYACIAAGFLAGSRELKRLEATSRSPLLSLVEESLSGAILIRAYGHQDRFMEVMHERIDACIRPHDLLWSANRWLAWRVDAVGSLVSLTTASYALIMAGRLDSALAGLALSYSLSFTAQILWVVRMYGVNEMNMNSVERIHEYLGLKQEKDMHIPPSVKPADWPSNGTIQFKNLTMAYGDDGNSEPVLRNITLEIPGGERVGVVGRTGAGKSTLITALFRFLEPRTGQVLVDGVDIQGVGLQELRSGMTIIPQEPTLFAGTLRTNADPLGRHTDREVCDALVRVGLMEAEHGQGHGYGLSTGVVDGGENFSQGERQLVALSRAILRKSRIVVMDEATASVDYGTDERMQEMIGEVFRGKTLVCVAHRLRTIIDYDRILVLDAGEVVENDSPRVLLRREGGHFYRMCQKSGDPYILGMIAEEAGASIQLE